MDGDSTFLTNQTVGLFCASNRGHIFECVSAVVGKRSSSIMVCVSALGVLDQGSNLQQESRTLWHEDESDKCGQSRKQAYENEQPPAVHLEL